MLNSLSHLKTWLLATIALLIVCNSEKNIYLIFGGIILLISIFYAGYSDFKEGVEDE